MCDMEAEDNIVPFSYITRELGVESSSASKPCSIYAVSHHPSNAWLPPPRLPCLSGSNEIYACVIIIHIILVQILTFPLPFP